jgi:branched-subunit amino acid transport protein AzlD
MIKIIIHQRLSGKQIIAPTNGFISLVEALSLEEKVFGISILLGQSVFLVLVLYK